MLRESVIQVLYIKIS